MNCLNCNQETSNPKFCSMSCSAKYNNSKYPKRIKSILYCASCGCEKKSNVHKDSKYCRKCRPNYGQDMTLGEAIYTKHGAPNAHTLVRVRARQVANKLNLTKCSRCGYDKHIEIAHIKGVATFPKTALLSEINDITNLIALCPNCHWEFDHLPREPQEPILHFDI